MQLLHYQGNEIRRRQDGYFDANSMCRAAGGTKRPYHWLRLDSTKALVEALSKSAQICAESLIETQLGRKGETWVHPHVAIAVAQWLSPEFHAWCIGVVYRQIEGPKEPTSSEVLASLPPEAAKALAVADALQRIHTMMEQSCGVDSRDILAHKRSIKMCHDRAQLALAPAQGITTNESPVFRFQERTLDPKRELTVVEIANAYLEPAEAQRVLKVDSKVGTFVSNFFKAFLPEVERNRTTDRIGHDDGLFQMARNGFQCIPFIYGPKYWDIVFYAMSELDAITVPRATDLINELKRLGMGCNVCEVP